MSVETVDTTCTRCGRARSWHLGLGGMGMCVPIEKDPDGRTGGFEAIDELEELMGKAVDEYYAQERLPKFVPTYALSEKWPGVDWTPLVIAHIDADPRAKKPREDGRVRAAACEHLSSDGARICGDVATWWDYDQYKHFCDRHVEQADFSMPLDEKGKTP